MFMETNESQSQALKKGKSCIKSTEDHFATGYLKQWCIVLLIAYFLQYCK